MTEPSTRRANPTGPATVAATHTMTDQYAAVLKSVDEDAKLKEKIVSIRARYDESYRIPVTQGEPSEGTLELDDMKALLLTAANGDYELPAQSVVVEYLRIDQKLLLPAALAYNMATIAESECRVATELYERYLRVSGMNYGAVKALVLASTTPMQIREKVDAEPLATGERMTDSWLTRPDLGIPSPDRESVTRINMIFATLSYALQFNCDIRDVGMLTKADMRANDGDWMDVKNTPKDRLRSKLKPLTIQSIAALNLPNVARLGLSAWVRAFAVSSGVLPSVSSKTQVEYTYTYDHPSREAMKETLAYQRNCNFNLHTVCLNVVAMFGLLHLAKDHTYKSNDLNMERICTSWIMTLRTIIDSETIDLLKANIESICRTAAHPFGLGQTYWVARLMDAHNLLAAPLAIRTEVTPPNVQRVMIVKAATEEWSGLASGQLLNRLFSEHIDNIIEEYNHIVACPPAYSNLWRLYAITEPKGTSDAAHEAYTSMMPIVYGYSMAMHVDEDKKRDGLALALSFANVARDNKVLAKTLETIWGRYLDDVSKTGLLDFVAQSAKALGVEMVRMT